MRSRVKHTAIVGGWDESDKDFRGNLKKWAPNKLYILFY